MANSAGPLDRIVAAAAICRALLLGRAAIVLIAAGAGLLLVEQWWRVAVVMALVTVTTVAEVAALTRWPSVARHRYLALGVDLVIAVVVLVLSRGGMAYFGYVTGTAALAGALFGMRALPLWFAQAALGFAALAVILRENPPAEEVTAFVAAFPMISVLAGMGAAAATAALLRYTEMAAGVITTAQRYAAASERARLARELHDSVAKTLRGVSFAALALPSSLRRHPQLAEQLANTVSQGAEAAAREARALLEGLRLDALDQPFHATVRSICHDWSRSTGIEMSVVADDVDLSVALRYELARILREALLNVERHANADQVRVCLAALGQFVELSVRDNGDGFVTADLALLQGGGHYGIVGMFERARAVNGTFEVSSAPGAGTLVTIRAPLDGLLTSALSLLATPDGLP